MGTTLVNTKSKGLQSAFDLFKSLEPVTCTQVKISSPMQPIQNASDILLAVIDATPDAIFVKDLEGR